MAYRPQAVPPEGERIRQAARRARRGAIEYNYSKQSFPELEAPGLSVFLRDGNDVLHTYSTYARGLDLLISTYNYLDLTPRGRNEKDLPYTMSWVRHHDRYATDGSRQVDDRSTQQEGKSR